MRFFVVISSLMIANVINKSAGRVPDWTEAILYSFVLLFAGAVDIIESRKP